MFHFIPSFTFLGFSIGGLYVYSWGLMASLGVSLALWLGYRKKIALEKESQSFKFPDNSFWNFAILLVLATFLGARVSYILETWNFYLKNPIEAFKLWEGGFSFFGGAALAIIFGFIWSKIKKQDFLMLGAIFTPAWLFGLFFGRIGCFLIHDHLGNPTNLPWWIFLEGAYRHEPALYEAVLVLILALGLHFWNKRRPLEKNIFPISLIFYSLIRFWLDFLRAGASVGGDDRFGNLTVAQWFCVLIFVLSLMIIKRKK